MAIYAIGDVHLSLGAQKPMDIFGEQWSNHAERIASSWRRDISDQDVVLIPGDISWAMSLHDAKRDLHWIGQLPGTKVMIRGNHDYWWHAIGKVRSALPDGCYAIQNDAMSLNGFAVCGTRGWVVPSHPKFTEDDEHIYRREAERLRLSLVAAQALELPIIAMLHYPPCGDRNEVTLFTSLMESHGVVQCIYGHLHGAAHRFAVDGDRNGVSYRLVSADYLQFAPMLLCP